jgi:hypothetical protein
VLWVLVGFLELCCGLAELLLCILLVYLGAPYTFLIKFSYLSKKKKSGKLNEISYPIPSKALVSTLPMAKFCSNFSH